MVNVNETGPQIAVANLGGTVTLKHYNENIYLLPSICLWPKLETAD